MLVQSMDAAIKVLSKEGGDQGQKVVSIVLEMIKDSRRCALKSAPVHPIIILEGLDGTGKSTILDGLQRYYGDIQRLRSPPERLCSFRAHFDKQSPHLRRSFYTLGNYACALSLREVSGKPIAIDRFWPSTVAYALAFDYQVVPDDMSEESKVVLKMPLDLQDLMPGPVIGILLHLPEEERVKRVRVRAATDMTSEEMKLEENPCFSARIMKVYRALKIGDNALLEVDASGSNEEVLQRVHEMITSQCEQWTSLTPVSVPKSVNWHFTRQCNYHCGFCFHTAKTSFCLPSSKEGLEESKHCLSRLRDAGMQKLNFSGGEPFLHPKALGKLVRFCKQDLCLESVTIVSNGSKITREWFEEFGEFLDILAVSCDSFQEATNMLIGRGEGNHLEKLENIHQWCQRYKVLFKINSVINKHNVKEDMIGPIERLKPVRWKVFQCLLIQGENAGEGAKRNAEALTVTSEEFQGFLQRHRNSAAVREVLVPEDNETMKDSYLILDEYLCFLNCTTGGKVPSPSIREVSVARALREAGFDLRMFVERHGEYEWSKEKVFKSAAKRSYHTKGLLAFGISVALILLWRFQR